MNYRRSTPSYLPCRGQPSQLPHPQLQDPGRLKYIIGEIAGGHVAADWDRRTPWRCAATPTSRRSSSTGSALPGASASASGGASVRRSARWRTSPSTTTVVGHVVVHLRHSHNLLLRGILALDRYQQRAPFSRTSPASASAAAAASALAYAASRRAVSSESDRRTFGGDAPSGSTPGDGDDENRTA